MDKLSPGGIALLFYAGHGIQAQGSNYLLPTDVALSVEDDLKYEAIDLQDILNKLADTRVRLSIIILDACRDNPFKAFRSAVQGLARIDPPRGTVIAYSTSPGKVAADGKGANSVYTSELIKAISLPGLKLMDVFERVTDAVERQTGNAQTPWLNSSFRGDFYFIGPTIIAGPSPVQSDDHTAAEIVFWQSIVNSTNPADYEAYLVQYPHGSFTSLARVRITSLRSKMSPSQTPVDLEFALREALSMVSDLERISQAHHYAIERDGRAMAVAPKRHASWRVMAAPDSETAETQALEGCQVFANEPCMLVASGDRILPKTATGTWPTQSQARVAYRGEFDLAQVPMRPNARTSPPLKDYREIRGAKALAFHPWGRIFLGTGTDLVMAETIALKNCNDDPLRKGDDGPCFLYAVGDQVVLPDRRIAP